MLSKLVLIFLLIGQMEAKNSLGPGECLYVGDKLTSNNGCFSLIMQNDGNVVIYKNSNGRATWSPRTDGTNANRACMQMDGNFVISDTQNRALWSCRSEDNEGSSIIMQDDGNLVVYAWRSTRAIWSPRSETPC